MFRKIKAQSFDMIKVWYWKCPDKECLHVNESYYDPTYEKENKTRVFVKCNSCEELFLVTKEI